MVANQQTLRVTCGPPQDKNVYLVYVGVKISEGVIDQLIFIYSFSNLIY
jgi:hypothetical protein